MIRYFEAFAGIGAFRSAFEKVGGFECVGWCEIDRFAQKSSIYGYVELQETLIMPLILRTSVTHIACRLCNVSSSTSLIAAVMNNQHDRNTADEPIKWDGEAMLSDVDTAIVRISRKYDIKHMTTEIVARHAKSEKRKNAE